jgi:hypothetical protein
MAYDYLDQNIVASALIQPHNNDSFYNPTLGHDGFAFNGRRYTAGREDPGPVLASWFTEPFGQFRGDSAAFPPFGLILLSPVSLVILDESIPTLDPKTLTLWMQFLLSDNFALTNNFNRALDGWTPSALSYADGVISVTYVPDEGSQIGGLPLATDSNMVVNIDFAQDSVFADVAVLPVATGVGWGRDWGRDWGL